jgi:ADP-heptose:LPS heptosyltransferase
MATGRPPAAARQPRSRTVLVHLASGIGNIVLATPLLLTLSRRGYVVDILVDGDYPETADLFAGWSALRAVYNGRLRQHPTGRYDFRIAAIPPFYWSRFGPAYRGVPNSVARPPDALFYRDERAYYLEFARALGCDLGDAPDCFLPAMPDSQHGIGPGTVVIAPGCKTGRMAAKRWPHFPRLAAEFADMVVVGTPDDLYQFDGAPMRFPDHVRSLIGQLTLRETANVLAAAAIVVANDSGLGHMAAALGVPTVLLFGPTPDATLGRSSPNVTVLRAQLGCEPCWFSAPLSACGGRADCLTQLTVDKVARTIRAVAPSVSQPRAPAEPTHT